MDLANAAVDEDVLVRTRRSLHGVAELILAGPQYRRSGTIRLRVVDGGFATIKEPYLRVYGAELVAGERRLPLSGTTYADLASKAGVDVGAPEGLYHDGSGVSPEDVADADPQAARWIAGCLAAGAATLRRLAADQTPILWPEHFDVGVTVGRGELRCLARRRLSHGAIRVRRAPHVPRGGVLERTVRRCPAHARTRRGRGRARLLPGGPAVRR